MEDAGEAIQEIEKFIANVSRYALTLEAENADLRSGEYLARVIEERDRYRKALEEVQSAQFSNHGCMATILSDVSRIAAYALEATNEPT